MTATRVICPSCNQDYAARKDGNPRGHGCDHCPACPFPDDGAVCCHDGATS